MIKTTKITTLVITQPTFLPWCGYFDMMLRAETFVLLDDVQFSRQSWQQRNKIKTPTGSYWLTVPIRHRSGQKINEVEIDHSTDWISNHLKTIYLNYKKAPYFNEIFKLLEKQYKKKYKKLVDLNSNIIIEIKKYLGIKTKIVYSHDLLLHEKNSSDRVIEICKILKTRNYLNGIAGKKLYKKSDFSKQNLNLVFHKYNHPQYNQLWGRFISHLSVVDVLFNMGKDSFDIIYGKNKKTS